MPDRTVRVAGRHHEVAGKVPGLVEDVEIMTVM
jgi:hypothetical protein